MSTAVDKHVGIRTRSRRMAQGLTVAELAVLVGVSECRMVDVESGAAHVGASQLRALAAALAVTPAYFFQDLDAGASWTTDRPRMSATIDRPGDRR